MKAALEEVTIAGRPAAVGAPVRVLPSRPGKRDGFETTIRSITVTTAGVVEVAVFGGRDGRRAWRVFTPDRLAHARRRAARP